MRVILIFFMVSIFLVSPLWAGSVLAQVFKFQLDGTSPIPVGGSFQVKILINTGDQKAISGDAMINFEPAKVSITSATTGNFFPYFSAGLVGGSGNKYLVSSWEENVAYSKSATSDQIFATLTLKAETAGSTSLSFECVTPDTGAESSILRSSDLQDLLNCSTLSPLTLNIGAAGPTVTSGPTGTPTPTLRLSPTSTPSATPTFRPTNTPVPTNTPRPTNTPIPTVSELPRAGIFLPTIGGLFLGTLLTVVRVLIIL